jgi:large subunit ribosomal protein L18
MRVKHYSSPRKRRRARIRGKVVGNAKRPRLSVFRSGKHIYAQLVDDEKATTLASSSDLALKKGSKIEQATAVGEELAKKALSLKIKSVVFDRGGYRYHGRVKAVADGARKGGLEF